MIYDIASFVTVIVIYGLWIGIGTWRIKMQDDVRRDRRIIAKIVRKNYEETSRRYDRHLEAINRKTKQGYHVESTTEEDGVWLVSDDNTKNSIWYGLGG